MGKILQFLPALLGAIMAILGVFVGNMQEYISAHPAVAAVLAAVYGILSNLMPSPVKVSKAD